MIDKSLRLEYLDIAKGILIFLVVLGHVMPEEELLHSFIYSFHIPAFFVIDGFLLNYKSFEIKPIKTIIISQIKYLIIPYIIYCIPLMIGRWYSSGFSIETLRFQTIDMILMCGIGAMWFLPCLFLARILFYAIKLIIRRCNLKKITPLISILLICIPSFINSQTGISLVILRSIVAVGFLVFGDYIFYNINKLNRYGSLVIMSILIVILFMQILLFIITGYNTSSLNVLKFGNIIYYTINGILGSLVIIFISIYSNMKLSSSNNIIKYIGKNSLFIMGTHQLIMIIFSVPIVNNYLINLLIATGIIYIECVLIKIIKGIKRKVMVIQYE